MGIRGANQCYEIIIYLYFFYRFCKSHPLKKDVLERERKRRNATSLDDYEAVMNIYFAETKATLGECKEEGVKREKKNEKKGKRKE